jgi:hypothetical protein
MHQSVTESPEIKFIKLRNGSDIVAFILSENESSIHIKRPLYVQVENDFQNGRQMVDVREFLPPIITDAEDVVIPKSDVMTISTVRQSFKDEFNDVVNYFYSVKPRKRDKAKSNSDDKIVPFNSRDSDKIH